MARDSVPEGCVMRFTLAVIGGLALFSTQAGAPLSAQEVKGYQRLLGDGTLQVVGRDYTTIRCRRTPDGSVTGPFPQECGGGIATIVQATTLERAHEICLKRWWKPGGMTCAPTGERNTYVCQPVNYPPTFDTEECRMIDERWKASGASSAEKFSAERAEREDREFVERVAKEKP